MHFRVRRGAARKRTVLPRFAAKCLEFCVFEKASAGKMVFRIDDRIFEDQMGAGQFWERNMSGVRGENGRFGQFADDFSG